MGSEFEGKSKCHCCRTVKHTTKRICTRDTIGRRDSRKETLQEKRGGRETGIETMKKELH